MPSATTEVVARIALAWMKHRPFSEEGRARRKAKREAKRQQRHSKGKFMPGETVKVVLPDGTETTRTEPLIPLRTATKATVGTAVLGYPLIDIVQAIQGAQIPVEWLESFTNGPVFEWLCYSIIPIVIARFTKSPTAKQAL
jgi:hypothetical protein